MIVATKAGLHPMTTVPVEIEHLGRLVSVVLNKHTNQESLCAVWVRLPV